MIRNTILKKIADAGVNGMTAAELETSPEFVNSSYHGPVSGHLSTLHREGMLARLSEKRTSFMNGKNRHFKIYVLTSNVNGRLTEEQGVR